MKWGTSKNKKLPPSSNTTTSSSKPFLISHVFPSSWLSKFKQKNGDSEPTFSKAKRKGQRNSPSLRSPRSASRGGGRFYGDDDGEDGFWRLSFGEDSAEVRDSSFGSSQTSATKMEERRVSRNEEDSLKKELDFKREAVKSEEESTKTEQEDVPEILTVRTILTKERGLASGARKHKHHNASSKKSRSSNLKTIEEELSEEQPSLDWQTLKERKIQEVMAKSAKHRKSVHISRDLQRRPRPKRSSKFRVFSPRIHSRVQICKIKALQDIARAKKAAAKERKVQQVRTGLDSFAVVKCSYDPQQDFRDSMVEMIVEKKLTRLDDLEELLACYLTLNSDEYHDLIIKVFRQVWFDLNQACFGSGILQKQECCND